MLGMLNHIAVDPRLHTLNTCITGHQQHVWKPPSLFTDAAKKKSAEKSKLPNEQNEGKARLGSSWLINMANVNPPGHCFMASVAIANPLCCFSRTFCHSCVCEQSFSGTKFFS